MAQGQGYECQLHGGGAEAMKLSVDQLTIARILRVNHAGEHCAIRIYAAQIAVSRLLYNDISSNLDDIRQHEINHRKLFRDAMKTRSARPCRAMFLWGWGGYLLGFVTALLGRRMIWICTEAVEMAVHRHLEEQLHFLKAKDYELHKLILSIQQEELNHLSEAASKAGKESAIRKLALTFIGKITDTLIWLSTWGASSRLAKQFKETV